MPKPKNPKLSNLGLYPYRCKTNRTEAVFALAWAQQNAASRTLAYLLDPDHTHRLGPPKEPDRPAQIVAATVIQWLGSEVGQSFLSDVGFVLKSKGSPR